MVVRVLSKIIKSGVRHKIVCIPGVLRANRLVSSIFELFSLKAIMLDVINHL